MCDMDNKNAFLLPWYFDQLKVSNFSITQNEFHLSNTTKFIQLLQIKQYKHMLILEYACELYWYSY